VNVGKCLPRVWEGHFGAPRAKICERTYVERITVGKRHDILVRVDSTNFHHFFDPAFAADDGDIGAFIGKLCENLAVVKSS